MPENPKTAIELLEQLRREYEEIGMLIKGLEKRLGITPQPTETEPELAASPRVTVSVDSVPVGFFHNLSQAQATEKLLRLNPGQPLSTTQILDAFRRSGVPSNPKNAATILYTTLARSHKFERVAGKAWGLSEWYPEKKRRKEKESDEDAKDDVA